MPIHKARLKTSHFSRLFIINIKTKFFKTMKKIFCFILVVMMALMVSSCVATDVMVVSDTPDVIYMDSGNRYVVVYINGIANYRFWDPVYSRYYYRPVPRNRYHYIGHPVRVTPPKNPRHYDTRPPARRPSTPVPDKISPQPRPDSRMGGTTQPTPRGRGSFGGRR